MASDGDFLELLQASAFNYFWSEANPTNGLVRDRSTPTSFCSIAAVGFGLTAIGIGIDHGWITREQGRARVLTTLRTFWERPQGDAPAGTIGHQYTQCWIDLRAVADAPMRSRGITYFENSRRATLANKRTPVANPGCFAGYGPDLWGFTACDGPKGYSARGVPPPENDDGTIAPTAAGGSIPFTPAESLAVLRNLDNNYRTRLWSPYGFRDAFNLQADWWGSDVLGIDQGPILLMIENHRTGRVWDRLRGNPVIHRGLKRAGFEPVPASIESEPARSPQGVGLECLNPDVGKYEKVEFRLQLPTTYVCPFDPDEVRVDLEVTTPGGRLLAVPGFYAQDFEHRRLGLGGQKRDWVYPVGQAGWKARFASGELGSHLAVARVSDARGVFRSGAVRFCVRDSARPGFVRVSTKDPRFLEFSEGRPFFPIGQNLAFIGNSQHVTLGRVEEVFAQLNANGANYLRVWACCEDWAMAIEARKSAWGRSWDWRPPFVPMPGDESSGRKCLRLSRDRPSIEANPSHPVALRPKTRYILRGKGRVEGGGRLEVGLQGRSFEELPASTGEPVWFEFRKEFATGGEEHWLDPVRFRLEGGGAAWIADVSLKEADGEPELLWEADVSRPARGWYNPLDCFMLDEVVSSAERHGLHLQLVLLTRDLYMNALKDPASGEYDRAIADARRLMRYAVARWGWSTSVAAWEYWNEMNPGLPTDRFYRALGDDLEVTDVYHHLRTTSTWGPSARDCRHPKLDLADTHFYLRPSDAARLADEVEAVLDRARWLREHAPHKPAFLGEFGLADNQWRITDLMKQSPELADFHNALWASALSGASGTALAWWWERLDQKNAYPAYKPLSRFLRDVPWTAGGLEASVGLTAEDRVRLVVLRTRNRAWVWLFHRAAGWAGLARVPQQEPGEVQGAEFDLKGWPDGPSRVQWWDTRHGLVTGEETLDVVHGAARIAVPPFARDVAARIEVVSPPE